MLNKVINLPNNVNNLPNKVDFFCCINKIIQVLQVSTYG